MSFELVPYLQEGRKKLEAEIQQVDLVIEQAASVHGRESGAVAILLQGRGRLQPQIDRIDQTICDLQLIAEGKEHPIESKPIKPGQYGGMRIGEAVKSYMNDHGRGPIQIPDLVKHLIAGGMKVPQDRSKYRAGELRDPEPRDLRLLCQNNAGGKGKYVRYVWDKQNDTISMIVLAREAAEKHKK